MLGRVLVVFNIAVAGAWIYQASGIQLAMATICGLTAICVALDVMADRVIAKLGEKS